MVEKEPQRSMSEPKMVKHGRMARLHLETEASHHPLTHFPLTEDRDDISLYTALSHMEPCWVNL
jgi:hypothetical protein